jgi:endonuclease YncB( thermonuclease family)
MVDFIEATVIAILSGDTVLVKYSADRPSVDGKQSRYAVAVLPLACAPALAIFSRNQENDPFAIESLEFLRGLLQGKQVMLTREAHMSLTFAHQTLGDLPVAMFSIELLNSHGSIDITLITAGWGRVRPISQIPKRLHSKICHDLEDAALKKKIGVWGEPRPRIDPMTACQFDSMIVSLNRDFTFKLLEPLIDVELVGVVSNPEREKTREYEEFFGEHVLFQKVSIRVLARVLNSPLIVSMTVKGHDLSVTLLSEGFAKLNELTARHLSEVERFRDSPITSGTFQGKVKSVPSSSCVVVDTPAGERRLSVASIHSRQFDFHSAGEPFGFESWKFLRDAVLGNVVEVTILGPNVAQLSVNGRDVSEMMLRAGVAELGISRIHHPPSNIPALIEANAIAKSEHKGIYDSSPPKKLTPYQGTVAAVVSPTELSIYIPIGDRYQLKTFSLVNVQSESNSGFIILKAIRLLVKHFLHHDVDVPNSGVIYDRATRTDPRVLLVRAGYLCAGESPDRELVAAQAAAQKSQRGIWRPTFPSESIMFNVPATVTEVLGPTRVFLQVLSDVLQKIQGGLSKLLIKAREPVNPNLPYIMRVNWRTFRVVAMQKTSPLFFAIDHGFVVSREMGSLFECPEELGRIPPQCICCDLAHLATFNDPVHNDLVVKYMWNIFDSGALYQVAVVRPGLIPAVTLREIPDGPLLQAVFLKDGAVQLDRMLPPKGAYPEGLEKCEADAKRYQLGGWSGC